MSLRVKFGILLSLLGLAVLLALVASGIAFSRLQSEVRDPLRSMSSVLAVLGRCKAEVERARLLVRAIEGAEALPPFTRTDAEEFDTHLVFARQQLERADLASEWKIRSGRSALSNLVTRAVASSSLGNEYYRLLAASQGKSPNRSEILAARQATHASLSDLHDLIERIEDRIVEDTRSTVDFSDSLRIFLITLLGSAFLIVILTSALGIVLVRRWILNPVANLRAATARIASGDFAYRIPLDAPPGAKVDELRQLSAEVNSMAGMVKSLQDQRVEQERLAALGEMVRRLAHNLRNPLSGIRGLAETTRFELNLPSPETHELKEHQTKIILAVDRFEKWLNELLGVTRNLSINPESTRIDRWLAGFADAHRPSAQTRGIALDVDTSAGPAQALIDSRHLEHALSAIVSNAIESTSSPQARGTRGPGGAVRIVTRSADPNHPIGNLGSFWSIEVSDEGLGVPPDLRDSIFRPYFTTKRDGNGIGLAVALQVVKAHGGRIEVESPWPPRENGTLSGAGKDPWPAGARFTIYLPVDGPKLANDVKDMVASNGPSGAIGGQDPRDRR